jgi:aspartate/methionine/tyrosine aminotransferase
VSPNNPTGQTYPHELLDQFLELCSKHGLALILDETYRDFLDEGAKPHDLFSRRDWSETLIHLYSFSKVFRLTGHRVGAMISGKERIAEAEKFLDSVAICPTQLGQKAALFGLQNLKAWAQKQSAGFRECRAFVEAGFDHSDWQLLGCGAYFAFARHPFTGGKASDICRALVSQQGLLILPGTMFAPNTGAFHEFANQTVRIAFANTDKAGLAEMFARLRSFAP